MLFSQWDRSLQGPSHRRLPALSGAERNRKEESRNRRSHCACVVYIMAAPGKVTAHAFPWRHPGKALRMRSVQHGGSKERHCACAPYSMVAPGKATAHAFRTAWRRLIFDRSAAQPMGALSAGPVALDMVQALDNEDLKTFARIMSYLRNMSSSLEDAFFSFPGHEEQGETELADGNDQVKNLLPNQDHYASQLLAQFGKWEDSKVSPTGVKSRKYGKQAGLLLEVPSTEVLLI
ncbi:uncharacterized protein LOC128854348 [Cuculus canorus]|uniref:uncharacterized protein LOC128854348 n=1 Tax=Cuculus canorus TaxID=55661 RepID=UPI0023AA577F|nr:uncharacterized protein LOC128854348 [Cuculus canorus]